MPDIRLRNINNFICNDINLEVHDREFLVFWGPTGAGKTTLLNVIAGLVKYDGSVLFDGIVVDRLCVRQRKVGYLFQNLILFPHLSVRANIAYGLTVQGAERKEIDSKVDELLELMEMRHLACRYPKNLSGGEKQRVALARAIAPSPQIMLLDEPLNSLDSCTASRLKMEILRLRRKLGLTIIYVTHSFEDVSALADRVVVLGDGKIVSVDFFENVFMKGSCQIIEERGYYDYYGRNKSSIISDEVEGSY